VQKAIAIRERKEIDDTRILYRIGINLGDVVIDGDDIHGDGVNIAARLEGLAKPGGICVSGSVHEQLAGKLDVIFEDGGEQTLKNISRPIRIWRWSPEPTDRGKATESLEDRHGRSASNAVNAEHVIPF
jgi:adenylate cyclase